MAKIFRYDVCIVGGLGHVGLPLGLSLAEKGLNVVAYDVNEKSAALVRDGKMPFLEVDGEEVLAKVMHKSFHVSTQVQSVAECKFVIVVIGTPVDEHLNPKFALFKKFIASFADMLSDEQHIILRSTVYPGITEKIRRYLRQRGKQCRVSFCPERIVQGQALHEIASLPQIVAAFDDAAFEEAAGLFSRIAAEIVRLEPAEAELAKLFNNVWRYIQFATANQFYTIATQNGLDYYNIHKAMTYKYPRAQSMPAAGFAAGPCLYKDTMQLAAFSGNRFFLGHSAMLINEGLPYFLLEQLKEKYDLTTKTVGILGMAFKANNDDKRESLSYKVRNIFEAEAQQVLCSDVYIVEEGFVSPEELIIQSDIVIVATPHREYASLNIPNEKCVVDIWNFYGKGGLI